MKFPLIAAVAAMTVLVSTKPFAAVDTGGLFSYELCEQSPRELAVSSKSDREFNFVTAMCKRHDSNYGKSDSEKTNFTFDNSDCPITFGRAASIFTSREELRALEKFCDKLKKESGKSGAGAMEATTASMRDSIHSFGSEPSDQASEATPSRFIRWTVIRSRSEGMPEECRYFYCDLEHYSGSRQDGPSNGWIVTLPRNKGKPDDCKKHYCRSVDTESSTREPINDNRGIDIRSMKIGY